MKTNRIRKSGFTLVELLLVIAIIGVLASMTIGVMANAQDEAKASATQARILQVETLLSMQLEDYEVRRLPISVRELGEYWQENSAGPELTKGGVTQPIYVAVQNLRRRILMDIINSEFPRPLLNSALPSGFAANGDVGSFPSTNAAATSGSGVSFSDWLDRWYPRPVNGVTLRARLAQLIPARVQSYGPMKLGSATDPDFDLPGEYLYAALERMDIDGTPATELLGNASIGNSDDDGYPEVIDAWGEPLQLRIWQINAIQVPQDSNGDTLVDVWRDPVPSDAPMIPPDDVINFDLETIIPGIPNGYSVLDPTAPRVIQKIRFEVLSTRLGRHF